MGWQGLPPERGSVAEEVYSRWTSRMTGVRELECTDASYAAQMHQWRRMFEATDLAMEDEGVDAETRRRVLNRVIYGHPTPDLAFHRAEERRRAMDKARLTTSSGLLDNGSKGLVGGAERIR